MRADPTVKPDADVLEEVACISCGETNQEPYFEAYDRIFGGGPYRYVRCARCGLIYQNPRIKPGYIGDYYPARSYTWKEFKGEKSLVKRLINRLEKFYIFHLYKKDKKRVTDFCKSIRLAPRRVLDLGCATGERLYLYRQDGCETIGVEMSEEVLRAKELYGVTVINSSVEDFLKNKGEKFDVITGYHILEHFHDPVSILHDVKDFLSDEGVLALEVPNADSFQFKIFKGRWHSSEAPRHLYVFSPKTLGRVLDDAGLKLVHHHTKKPFLNPSPVILSMVPALETRRMRMKELEGGGFSLLKRLMLIFGIYALAPFVYIESMLGRGPSLTAFAVKK